MLVRQSQPDAASSEHLWVPLSRAYLRIAPEPQSNVPPCRRRLWLSDLPHSRTATRVSNDPVRLGSVGSLLGG